MTAREPERIALRGRVVTLEPITRDALVGLFAAIGRPEVFAGGYGGGPAGYRDTLDGFVGFAEHYYLWDGPGVTFIVRRIADGRIVGTSTLGDLDLANEHAHLGWTAYAPEVWGTAVNPESKLLLLGHAFGSGFGRVKLQSDVLNERSRAAILRLGATFEGITRRDRRRADGTEEWPAVRAGLERRLGDDGAARVDP
jgi:RimJ/RimL family protein N-acetyltransferase